MNFVDFKREKTGKKTAQKLHQIIKVKASHLDSFKITLRWEMQPFHVVLSFGNMGVPKTISKMDVGSDIYHTNTYCTSNRSPSYMIYYS